MEKIEITDSGKSKRLACGLHKKWFPNEFFSKIGRIEKTKFEIDI